MSIDLKVQRGSCNPWDVSEAVVFSCDPQCMSPVTVHLSALVCTYMIISDSVSRLAGQVVSGISLSLPPKHCDFVRVLGLKLRSHA